MVIDAETVIDAERSGSSASTRENGATSRTSTSRRSAASDADISSESEGETVFQPKKNIKDRPRKRMTAPKKDKRSASIHLLEKPYFNEDSETTANRIRINKQTYELVPANNSLTTSLTGLLATGNVPGQDSGLEKGSLPGLVASGSVMGQDSSLGTSLNCLASLSALSNEIEHQKKHKMAGEIKQQADQLTFLLRKMGERENRAILQ